MQRGCVATIILKYVQQSHEDLLIYDSAQNHNELAVFACRNKEIIPAMALVLPCAQQEPQYWGICWLRVVLA